MCAVDGSQLDEDRADQAAKSRCSWQLPNDCALFSMEQALQGFIPAFDPGAGPWPSICPGCDPRNPLNFTRADWQAMALSDKAAAPHMQLMYQYGARDAELWVRNQTEGWAWVQE